MPLRMQDTYHDARVRKGTGATRMYAWRRSGCEGRSRSGSPPLLAASETDQPVMNGVAMSSTSAGVSVGLTASGNGLVAFTSAR